MVTSINKYRVISDFEFRDSDMKIGQDFYVVNVHHSSAGKAVGYSNIVLVNEAHDWIGDALVEEWLTLNLNLAFEKEVDQLRIN